MNEAPFPTQSAVPPSLPPPSLPPPSLPPSPPPSSPRSARRRAPSLLRASLSACTAEGLAAEIVSACFGNAVITAWGVELGVSPLLLGALWGVPYFGQIFQIPAAWITSRFGRRRVSIVAHALARQATLPLAALPLLDLSVDAQRALLVALLTLSSLLGIVGHNAWLAWMGELVPSRIRGAYFGRRGAMCALAATIASLAVAFALDAGRWRGRLGAVLAVVVVLRSAAGVATTFLMAKQHDPPGAPRRPRLRDVILPIVDRAYRRLLTYRAAWGVATGLTASVSAVFMLRALGLGFLGLAIYAALVGVLRVVTTPLWGRALDRAGGRSVLVACSLGAAVSSFAWIGATPTSSWLVVLDALCSGLLLGGQELAVFTLPLDAAPSSHRPLFAAMSVMVGGVAYGLACVGGGAMRSSFSERELLAISAVMRVLAALLALRLHDPSRGRAAIERQTAP